MGKYFCLAEDPHPTLSFVLIMVIAVFGKHVEVPGHEFLPFRSHLWLLWLAMGLAGLSSLQLSQWCYAALLKLSQGIVILDWLQVSFSCLRKSRLHTSVPVNSCTPPLISYSGAEYRC